MMMTTITLCMSSPLLLTPVALYSRRSYAYTSREH